MVGRLAAGVVDEASPASPIPSSSVISRWTSSADWEAGGFQQIPALPDDTSPAAVSKVTAADGRAKSASRFARTGWLRPRSASRKPTVGSARSVQLGLELGELREAALEGRVRREE